MKKKSIGLNKGFRLPNGATDVVVHRENRGGGFASCPFSDYHLDGKYVYFKYPGVYRIHPVMDINYELVVEAESN